jgi:AcrR family transcriptional regulator
MGSKERKERNKQNLRQAILDAAQELFVHNGYDNVSMRKIAEKIEYSPTTIYLYFKDKRGIFEALMEDYFTRLKKAINSSYDEKDDLLTSMKNDMRTYILFGLENPDYYRLAFINNPEMFNDSYLKDGEAGTSVFMNLKKYVTECIRVGIFRKMDVNLAVQVIWTMNHGITSLLISNPNFPWVDRESLINQSIESTIEGFRPKDDGRY